MTFGTLSLCQILNGNGALVRAAIVDFQEHLVTKDERAEFEERFAKHVAGTAQIQTLWSAGLIIATVGAAAAIVHFAN